MRVYHPVMGRRGPKPGDEGYRPPATLLDRAQGRSSLNSGGCWIWLGNTDAKGYARATTGSRIDGTYKPGTRIARALYEEEAGPIPAGLTIDHLCANTSCVNPSHLEVVTNAENIRRGSERMTTCRRGHPINAENTYTNPKTGKRQCRVCKRIKAFAKTKGAPASD